MANSFLAAMDAAIHAACASAGIADACEFLPVAGIAAPGSCYVDKDTASFAMRGLEFRKGAALVTLLRDGIDQRPREGDAVDVDGEIFTVAAVVDSDDSRWVMECRT